MSDSNYIWFEKYRPTSLEEMTLSPNNMRKFRKFVQDCEIPHLLFSGGPGSGKSTISEILIKELNAVALRLNASSADRGVETMRTKVLQFARANKRELKIVFIDEADGLTKDAQDALRNTIEKFSANCRFILTCNNLEKINPALKSRCAQFTFDQFSKGRLLQLVGKILQAEQYKAPKSGVAQIIEASYPDIRSGINLLQEACSGPKFSLQGLASVAVDHTRLLKLVRAGKIYDIRNMLSDCVDYSWVFKLLFMEFIPTLATAHEKSDVVLVLADYMHRATTTTHQDINFCACLCDICDALKVTPKF